MGKKSKRFDYFEGFERQARLACEEAELLIEVIEGYTTPQAVFEVLPKAHQVEHKGDGIGHDVFMAIATDFITPIEREDIISLTMNLDDILDYIEDVIQRFYVYDIKEVHPQAKEFAEIIRDACSTLLNTLGDFQNFKKSKKFKELVVEINDYEEQADRLFMEITHDLYVNHQDKPLYVVVWSEIFKRMERCTDACEHVADTMRSVALKNA